MAAVAIPSGVPDFPRVNLMPRGEVLRRDRALLVRRWVLAIVAALGVVLAASAVAYSLQIAAAGRLAAENLRSASLLGELAAASDVREALTLQDDLVAFRADAMASDVDWVPLGMLLQPAFPADAVVVGFQLTPGGMPQTDDPAAEIGVVGTFTVVSPTLAEVSPLVRAIRPMSGVREVDGWTSRLESGVYEHEIRFTFDQSVYTRDFAAEEQE